MALLTKSEMYYNDYSWTAYSNDNPKVSGEPDSTFLNRMEGYEVLYFINKFCDLHKLKLKNEAIKVERMIRHEVPSNIHSQQNIKSWIEQNWR